MRKKLSYVVITLVLLGLVSPSVAQVGKGNILVEEWTNTGGAVTDNLDTLKAYAQFPDNPTRTYWAKSFDRPDGGEDNWGGRFRGFLYPPETGNYTFWTCSDDDSELWLSTDDNPANIKMIANVEGWMPYLAWDGAGGAPGTNFKSQPVALQAGKKYYVEGLWSDGTGGGFQTVGWGGPGIGAGPVVVAGKYLSPVVRDPEPMFMAQNPSPANGAGAVTMLLMTWSAGATAVFHDVYFGTDPNPPKVASMLTYMVYFHPMPMTPGATYYWKIDEIEVDGVTRHEGPVWSFKTIPVTASNPLPRNGDKWIDPAITLTWAAGQGATKHEVYFGTDQAAVAARDASVAKGQVVAPSFNPGALANGTTYYWAVDELAGATKHAGAVWSFTTVVPGTGGIKGEYFGGMSPTGVPALVRIDPAIDFSWGDPGGPGAPIGVDQFSARWTADLEIAIADTYTFIGRSDDGIRIWLNDDLIIDAWVDRGATDSFSAPMALETGVYSLRVEYYENGGGAEAHVLWQTATMARTAIPAGPLSPPVRAKAIYPADNDVNVPQDVVLMWSAGEKAVSHQVYFGEDEAAVAAATTASAGIYRGSQALDQTTFDPGTLEWNKAYYWRVDEVNNASTQSPWIGAVWSFTTADFLVVDNFEAYNDVEGTNTRIYETWIDGWAAATPNGGTVGNWDPPFAEQTIVHSGAQSMPFDYNNVNAPFYSEAYREFAPAQNWTVNGVTDLTLFFRGEPVKFVENAGVYTLSAAGADIYMELDECRFAYKQLTGDGSITLRLDSAVTRDAWTKTGLMIRGTLEPLSARVHMIAAAQQTLVEWMYRVANNDLTTVGINTNAGTNPLPVWLRITRAGNVFTGEYSANGTTWSKINAADGTSSSTTVTLPNTVYIGMVVTSHNAGGAVAEATFSEVRTTGNVSAGNWKVADIGIVHPGNDVAPLYVTLEDSTGKKATVTNADPAAVTVTAWTEWKIPLSQFTGVNAAKVDKVTIGVGDKSTAGHGMLYIDDIRVTKPAPAPQP